MSFEPREVECITLLNLKTVTQFALQIPLIEILFSRHSASDESCIWISASDRLDSSVHHVIGINACSNSNLVRFRNCASCDHVKLATSAILYIIYYYVLLYIIIGFTVQLGSHLPVRSGRIPRESFVAYIPEGISRKNLGSVGPSSVMIERFVCICGNLWDLSSMESTRLVAYPVAFVRRSIRPRRLLSGIEEHRGMSKGRRGINRHPAYSHDIPFTRFSATSIASRRIYS